MLISLVVLLGAEGVGPADVLAADRAEKLQQRRKRLRARYDELRERLNREVEKLAVWCDEKGLESEAAEARRLAQPFDAETLLLLAPQMPSDRTAPKPPAPAGDRAVWANRLKLIRKQYAGDLFPLARATYEADLISVAYDLCREIVEYDASHAGARRVLGFVRFRDGWVTPFDAGLLRRGFVWTGRWGWIPGKHVERFGKGQLPLGNRWVSRQEAQRYHADWENAWRVRTSHFEVRTNHDLESGVALGQVLENLHQVFFRLFVGYFRPKEQMRVLFGPGGGVDDRGKRVDKPYRVNFMATREEFIRRMGKFLPAKLAAASSGLYSPAQRQSFFYYNDGFHQHTVLHEATHQLFSQSKPKTQAERARSNFWVVEGIACHMEWLRFEGRRAIHDWRRSGRLWVAQKMVRSGRAIPFDRFVRLGVRQFQAGDVKDNYCQAEAMAAFFMQYDRGRYRDALVEYIQQVYEGRAKAGSLARLMGRPLAELEREYAAFVLALRKPPPLPARAGSGL